MIKVLVTGAQGQVGTCLVSTLEKRDDVDVYALGHNELDITNKLSVQRTMQTIKPDVVINAAAYTAVDRAESDVEFAYKVNAQACEYLAKNSEKYNSLLLHISTDYVFDGRNDKPYSEMDRPNPVTVYGKTKLAGEKAIQSFCHRYVIIRTAWVFGLAGKNFVKTMIQLGQNREELNVVADQFGAPTYAGDISSCLINIMDQIQAGNKSYGVYHFSGLPYTNWANFAEQIFLAVGNKSLKVIPIGSDQYPTVAIRPKNSRLDCRLLEKTFNIHASNWQEALKLFKE